jgi:hypothetical protein
MRFGLVEDDALIAAHPVLERRCQWAPKSPGLWASKQPFSRFLVFLPGGRPRRGWHRRRGNEGFGAKVLGHEIGVLKPFRVVALRLHH